MRNNFENFLLKISILHRFYFRRFLTNIRDFEKFELVIFRAYEKEEGDYKRLRSVKVPGSKTTWDIERNTNLRSLVDNIKTKHIQWFETDVETDLRGLPTLEHTRCIMWGFSHDVAKLKKLIPTLKEKLDTSESN